MKKFFQFYFRSWWLPTVLLFASPILCLPIYIFSWAAIFRSYPMCGELWIWLYTLAFFGSILGVIVAVLVNLFKHRWWVALANIGGLGLWIFAVLAFTFVGMVYPPRDSEAHLTIDEGDWGKPYAARFEVWFIPDSGAVERKLLERNFKIEGWQR